MQTYRPADIGETLSIIRINKGDFGRACQVAQFVQVLQSEGEFVYLETNRYSRRELIRNGISFCQVERKGK
jgi:hypothetical protein